MEIGRQIKKYRAESKLSQEELAEKIFVTRQTVSNWENDKNYPDINSLVLLGNLFGISLDILVKGDLEQMKEQVKQKDISKFNRDGAIFTVLLIIMGVSVLPLFLFLGFIGAAVWAVIVGVTMYYSIRIEKQKKKHDVQTYKEILAFTEGKKLDEIEKKREMGKRHSQNVTAVIASGSIALAVVAVMFLIFYCLGLV